MPFMVGKAPIRRTLKYLTSGKLVLKDNIQIFTLNYNTIGKNHVGAKEFGFWHLPQVQYKSPNIQMVIYKNMTPSPFVRCFFDNGKEMLIDIDGKSKDEILDHLIKVVGKSKEVLAMEALATEKKDNPANFGQGCEKGCICDIPGQLPCPGIVPLPHHMRGKYKYAKE